MSSSASSSDATSGKDGGGSAGGPTGGSIKKTNVCLICGIYTNLSLNIFEPRNGPNIREVIYQKYNFRAERGDNEDKYICYSCNNWLINWYSLQHLSESRNYESTPSSSRSQSQESRNKRPKNNGRSTSSECSGNKENVEQDDHVSSTVKTPEKENFSPRRKPKRLVRNILGENNQQNMVPTGDSSINIKPFECQLIRMLKNQGTTVIKENMPLSASGPRSSGLYNQSKPKKFPQALEADTSNSNEIVLSFNSAISEVVNYSDLTKTGLDAGEDLLYTHRLSRSLSITLINTVPIDFHH